MNLANKALELSGIGFRRAHPLFVFLDFVQHQLGDKCLADPRAFAAVSMASWSVLVMGAL